MRLTNEDGGPLKNMKCKIIGFGLMMMLAIVYSFFMPEMGKAGAGGVAFGLLILHFLLITIGAEVAGTVLLIVGLPIYILKWLIRLVKGKKRTDAEHEAFARRADRALYIGVGLLAVLSTSLFVFIMGWIFKGADGVMGNHYLGANIYAGLGLIYFFKCYDVEDFD